MSECPGLTDEQLKTTNGCGSSAWFARPFRLPKWLVGQKIHCACNVHDLAYQDITNTTRLYKRFADTQLYNAIVDDAMGSRWIMRHFKLAIAEIVYHALKSKISWWCWKAAKK